MPSRNAPGTAHLGRGLTVKKGEAPQLGSSKCARTIALRAFVKFSLDEIRLRSCRVSVKRSLPARFEFRLGRINVTTWFAMRVSPAKRRGPRNPQSSEF